MVAPVIAGAAVVGETIETGVAAEEALSRLLARGLESWFKDQWIYLHSSNLTKFFWDSDTSEMIIEFKGGRQYKYFNISEGMANDLANAPSPGRWWHANLKGAPAEKL